MRGRVAFGDILFASSGKKYAKNAAKTKALKIAEGKTIQNLGCVLPKPYVPTGKEVQKPTVSGALLGTFPRGKSTPPEAGQGNSHTNPTSRTKPHHKTPDSRRVRRMEEGANEHPVYNE